MKKRVVVLGGMILLVLVSVIKFGSMKAANAYKDYQTFRDEFVKAADKDAKIEVLDKLDEPTYGDFTNWYYNKPDDVEKEILDPILNKVNAGDRDAKLVLKKIFDVLSTAKGGFDKKPVREKLVNLLSDIKYAVMGKDNQFAPLLIEEPVINKDIILAWFEKYPSDVAPALFNDSDANKDLIIEILDKNPKIIFQKIGGNYGDINMIQLAFLLAAISGIRMGVPLHPNKDVLEKLAEIWEKAAPLEKQYKFKAKKYVTDLAHGAITLKPNTVDYDLTILLPKGLDDIDLKKGKISQLFVIPTVIIPPTIDLASLDELGKGLHDVLAIAKS